MQNDSGSIAYKGREPLFVGAFSVQCSGVLRLYGTKWDYSTNPATVGGEVIYEMNSATTLQDAIGVNDGIE